jgi:hypothetical protein
MAAGYGFGAPPPPPPPAVHVAPPASSPFFWLNFVFMLLVVGLGIWHTWRVALLVFLICGIVAVYAAARCLHPAHPQYESAMWRYVAGMLVLGVCATFVDIQTCSTCRGRIAPTEESVKAHLTDCAWHKRATQVCFGDNSDLRMVKTKDGLKKKHPECFDAWKEWKPCKIVGDDLGFDVEQLSCITK